MKKLDTLISLLAEARAEAERLGPTGKIIARQLDEALNEARLLSAQGGRADEGRRPQDLSSANDG